jgi:hypothetical protein
MNQKKGDVFSGECRLRADSISFSILPYFTPSIQEVVEENTRPFRASTTGLLYAMFLPP